jgi:hypothetical protein
MIDGADVDVSSRHYWLIRKPGVSANAGDGRQAALPDISGVIDAR